MKRMFIFFMMFFALSFVGGFSFASESDDAPKGCTELSERLDIENKSRGQFSGDINFYRGPANEPKSKDLLQEKQRYF